MLYVADVLSFGCSSLRGSSPLLSELFSGVEVLLALVLLLHHAILVVISSA